MTRVRCSCIVNEAMPSHELEQMARSQYCDTNKVAFAPVRGAPFEYSQSGPIAIRDEAKE